MKFSLYEFSRFFDEIGTKNSNSVVKIRLEILTLDVFTCFTIPTIYRDTIILHLSETR